MLTSLYKEIYECAQHYIGKPSYDGNTEQTEKDA
jgi:hypothetical protein